MAGPIDRTWFNTLIDDDGSGTTGTIWDKAQVDGLLDSVDAALAPCAVPAGGPGSVQFNAGGILGGDAGLTYDPATDALHVAGPLALGNGPSSFGRIRLSAGDVIAARNQANNGDISGLTIFTDDKVYVGAFANDAGLLLRSTVGIEVNRGITFPATQVPSADPNTLDDYREGLWIPALSATGGASGQSYNKQLGDWQKTGKWVTANFWLWLAAKGTLNGSLLVTGFPFRSQNTGNYAAGSLTFAAVPDLISISLLMPPDSVFGELRYGTLSTQGNATGLTSAEITDSTYFMGTVKYVAAN